MSKYIDAEKLRSVLQNTINSMKEKDAKGERYDAFLNGKLSICEELLGCIDSLQQEQPEGVPLTEEILQKNFPTPEEIIWWPLDDGSFRVEMQDDTHLIIGKYNYVHELQHALRLFGKNGEIKL